jgi:hypothetical protein
LLPSQANRAFLVVQPMGPMTAWQRLGGTVFSAGAGTLNLQTGVFTRTGVAINQLGIYGTDMAIMTTVRAAPGLIDAATSTPNEYPALGSRNYSSDERNW